MQKMYLRLLKPKLVFLIGFGVGFVLGTFFILIEELFNDAPGDREKIWHGQAHPHETGLHKFAIPSARQLSKGIVDSWINKNLVIESENTLYDNWLKAHNFQSTDMDMDYYLYSPVPKGSFRNLTLLESDWLRTKIHITCVVFVEKLKLAQSIKATWGDHCNKLYFFGQHLNNTSIPVINLGVKFMSSWQLLCEAMNYLWKNDSTLQWIIFVKDDTIVIPENLRYIVAPLDHKEDYYLGHPVVMWGQAYNVAQSGYVLSQAALKKILKMFDTPQKCAAGGKYWKKEDYYLGKHLSSIGIHPLDTRDEYLRGTFHGYTLQNLLWGITKAGSYWTRALYPLNPKCCSGISVTFSAGEPDKMYTLHYLLYHFQVFKNTAIFGSNSAPTSMPDEDVWKAALKEEFNITYLTDMSSDAYYELWHSKYLEPQQFIENNYHNVTSTLSSLLLAYDFQKMLNKSSSN